MSCECYAPQPPRRPNPSECTDGCPAYPEGCDSCEFVFTCDHCGRKMDIGAAYYLALPEPDTRLLRFCSEECLKDWLSVQKRKSAASV